MTYKHPNFNGRTQEEIEQYIDDYYSGEYLSEIAYFLTRPLVVIMTASIILSIAFSLGVNLVITQFEENYECIGDKPLSELSESYNCKLRPDAPIRGFQLSTSQSM